MSARIAAGLLCAALSFPALGGAAERRFSFTGQWRGVARIEGVRVTFPLVLDLVEADGRATGGLTVLADKKLLKGKVLDSWRRGDRLAALIRVDENRFLFTLAPSKGGWKGRAWRLDGEPSKAELTPADLGDREEARGLDRFAGAWGGPVRTPKGKEASLRLDLRPGKNEIAGVMDFDLGQENRTAEVAGVWVRGDRMALLAESQERRALLLLKWKPGLLTGEVYELDKNGATLDLSAPGPVPLERFAGRWGGRVVIGGKALPVQFDLKAEGNRLTGSVRTLARTGRRVHGVIEKAWLQDGRLAFIVRAGEKRMLFDVALVGGRLFGRGLALKPGAAPVDVERGVTPEALAGPAPGRGKRKAGLGGVR